MSTHSTTGPYIHNFEFRFYPHDLRSPLFGRGQNNNIWNEPVCVELDTEAGTDVDTLRSIEQNFLPHPKHTSCRKTISETNVKSCGPRMHPFQRSKNPSQVNLFGNKILKKGEKNPEKILPPKKKKKKGRTMAQSSVLTCSVNFEVVPLRAIKAKMSGQCKIARCLQHPSQSFLPVYSRQACSKLRADWDMLVLCTYSDTDTYKNNLMTHEQSKFWHKSQAR